MARLEMQRDSRTKEYELGDEMIMGRKSSCQIRVPSPKCSREHCRIIRGNDCFFIEDLGSSNGTIVNGKKIGSHLLKHNDEIMVGGVIFRFMDRSDDILVGRRLGKYQIIEKVGVGGMGVVYRASQVSLGREVALKVMNKRLAQEKNFIQSFEREAKIAARLHHPNIIGIHDFGTTEGWYYFSMEFVDGENLLDLALRQGGLTPDECIDYGSQIAFALDHAHSQGILHKDIKPQNVMIDRDDNVKLADMGLAQTMGGEDEVEMESASKDESGKKNTFMATPQYVAPEIIRRQDPDARSDLYSLSATLFHMLTGKPPFQDKTVKDLLRKHLNAPIPDPRELRPEISEDLAQFIMRGLAKNPEERIQSSKEYANELLRFSGRKEAKRSIPAVTSTIHVKPQSAESTVRHKSRDSLGKLRTGKMSTTAQTMLIAAGIVLIGIIGFVILQGGSSDSDAAELLKTARVHYVNGEDEQAKNILSNIIKDNPGSSASQQARAMLDDFAKEDLRADVTRIKKGFADKNISANQAKKKLQEILDNPLADSNIRQIIATAITEIDEESATSADIAGKVADSTPWDRKLRQMVADGRLTPAYRQAEKIWKTTALQQDKSLAWAIMEDARKKAAAKGTQLFNEAQQKNESGDLPAALKAYAEVVNIIPEVSQAEESAKNIANINSLSLQKIAQGWYAVVKNSVALNPQGIREATFQAGKGIEGLPAAKQLELFSAFPKAAEEFAKCFMANAEKATKEPNPYIRVIIGDKTPKARLEVKDNKLFAIGKNNRQQIQIRDVVPGDIEIVVPRLEASAEQVMGGALFMAGINQPDKSLDYLKALFTSLEDHTASANTLSIYARGIFPAATMEFFPENGNTFYKGELKEKKIVLSVNGLWYNQMLALPLNGLSMEIAQNGILQTQLVGTSGTVADFYCINGELRITVMNEGKKMSSSMRCSRGEFFVHANTNSIFVTSDGQTREIKATGIGNNTVWPLAHSKNVTAITSFTWGQKIANTDNAPSETVKEDS